MRICAVCVLSAVLVGSTGCALVLLGAGGTAGYFIRKGEEGGSTTTDAPKQEKAADAPRKTSGTPTGDAKSPSASD